jgi:membrane-associated protease RseP (regulator of RpoE activity)
MGPDDDADDFLPRPPPPRTERPWRHPSEIDERAAALGATTTKRPHLWIVLTASALVGTVVALGMVALVREIGSSGGGGVANRAALSTSTEPDASGDGGQPGDADEEAEEPGVDDTGAAGTQDGRTAGTLGSTLAQPSGAAPWLGIEGMDADGGVLVTGVAAAGPAATAGVRPGDVIVAAERKAVATLAELRTMLDRFEPGAVVVLDVLRDRYRVRLMAVLGVRS